MIGSFVSELTDLLLTMKHCHILDAFSITVNPSTAPLPSSIGVMIATLLTALECCNGQLRLWMEQCQIEQRSQSVYCEPLKVEIDRPKSEAPKIRPFTAKTDVNLGESAKVNRECIEALNLKIEGETECFGAVNLSVAPSPTCLEALNLSVVTSPAGLNLSVATSPCFHTADVNVGTATDFKTFLDVGTATECWDQVNLDVGGSGGYFEPVNLHAGSTVGFTHDGDIFNMGPREDLNAGLCFDLEREETPAQITPAESVALSVLEELPLLPAALDLSQAAVAYFTPPSPKVQEVLLNASGNPEDPVPIEEVYTCDECGKTFQWRKSLRRHISEHGDRKYLCHLCGKSYSEAWRLHKHEKHGNEGGYACNVCGRCFLDSSKLRRHVATHMTGEFVCSTCSKVFTRADLLKRHFEITHLKAKRFSCRLCSKVFSVKCNLVSHENSVHGGVTMECDLCGKQCKNKATLRTHRKTHMAPTYACEICGRAFHRLVQYRNHKRNKHPVKHQTQTRRIRLSIRKEAQLSNSAAAVGKDSEIQFLVAHT